MMTLAQAAGRQPHIINRLVMHRMTVDWAASYSSPEYRNADEARRAWAKAELDALNADIDEMMAQVMPRVVKYIREAKAELAKYKYDVTIGKPVRSRMANWATYEFAIAVTVTDTASDFAQTFTLKFEARDCLRVIDDKMTYLVWSDSKDDANLTAAALLVKFVHRTNWNSFVQWRQEFLADHPQPGV